MTIDCISSTDGNMMRIFGVGNADKKGNFRINLLEGDILKKDKCFLKLHRPSCPLQNSKRTFVFIFNFTYNDVKTTTSAVTTRIRFFSRSCKTTISFPNQRDRQILSQHSPGKSIIFKGQMKRFPASQTTYTLPFLPKPSLNKNNLLDLPPLLSVSSRKLFTFPIPIFPPLFPPFDPPKFQDPPARNPLPTPSPTYREPQAPHAPTSNSPSSSPPPIPNSKKTLPPTAAPPTYKEPLPPGAPIYKKPLPVPPHMPLPPISPTPAYKKPLRPPLAPTYQKPNPPHMNSPKPEQYPPPVPAPKKSSPPPLSPIPVRKPYSPAKPPTSKSPVSLPSPKPSHEKPAPAPAPSPSPASKGKPPSTMASPKISFSPIPRAPPIPKLPPIPKIPRRYFNWPKPGHQAPNPPTPSFTLNVP